MGDRTLIGYRFSVYTRAVRISLAEIGLDYAYSEVDPFADVPDRILVENSPFGYVPVLIDGGVRLYETSAILRYVDRLAPDAGLVPAEALPAARMQQVIGVVDSQAYRVLVRMVYSHGVFRPAMGESADADKLAQGLSLAPSVLAALEEIAAEGHVLGDGSLSLADIHLFPMLAAFAQSREGAVLMARAPRLAARMRQLSLRPAFRDTAPPELTATG